jgi:hypothetical protein
MQFLQVVPEKSATAWRESVVALLDSHSAVADLRTYECIFRIQTAGFEVDQTCIFFPQLLF